MITTQKQAWINACRIEGRRLRAAARLRGERYVKAGITHGLYGYSTYCCDCLVCRAANATRVRLNRNKHFLGVLP